MQKKREEILKILELKNEQSFYTKQRQGKKIINFLKSIPTEQLHEFNEFETNSYSMMSLEFSYIFTRKLLMLTRILKSKDKNEYILFHKFLQHVISSICESSLFPKFYDSNKNMNFNKNDFEYELFENYSMKKIRQDIFVWMTQFEDINQIKKNSGFGEFLDFLLNLNEYDYIHLVNNHIYLYQPLIVSFNFLKKEEVNNIKEFILIQLYYYRNFGVNELNAVQDIITSTKTEFDIDKFNLTYETILQHWFQYKED